MKCSMFKGLEEHCVGKELFTNKNPKCESTVFNNVSVHCIALIEYVLNNMSIHCFSDKVTMEFS